MSSFAAIPNQKTPQNSPPRRTHNNRHRSTSISTLASSCQRRHCHSSSSPRDHSQCARRPRWEPFARNAARRGPRYLFVPSAVSGIRLRCVPGIRTFLSQGTVPGKMVPDTSMEERESTYDLRFSSLIFPAIFILQYIRLLLLVGNLASTGRPFGTSHPRHAPHPRLPWLPRLAEQARKPPRRIRPRNPHHISPSH